MEDPSDNESVKNFIEEQYLILNMGIFNIEDAQCKLDCHDSPAMTASEACEIMKRIKASRK